MNKGFIVIFVILRVKNKTNMAVCGVTPCSLVGASVPQKPAASISYSKTEIVILPIY
jgi:hypothetical protein